MQLSEKAIRVIRNRSVKARVMRNGMLQQMTFTIKTVKHGNIIYTELYTDRLIDVSELTRVANELGLPVEAQNGKAFPTGTSAMDFQVAAPSQPAHP